MEDKLDLILEVLRTSEATKEAFRKAVLKSELSRIRGQVEEYNMDRDVKINRFMLDVIKEKSATAEWASAGIREKIITISPEPGCTPYEVEFIKDIDRFIDGRPPGPGWVRDFTEVRKTPLFDAECDRRFGPALDVKEEIEKIKAKYNES